MRKFLLSGVFIIFWSILWVSGQNITERHWYFGSNSNGFVIDKSARDATVVDDQATPFGNHGSTVIADKLKGNLLFYSDGEVIYDNQHQLLPGLAFSRLNGDLTKIQPVVSCPFPDNSQQYYIFTNSGSTIEYSVVDASLQGNSTMSEFPRGDITLLNQPTGITDAAELFKVLESADGQSFWLVTQDVNTLDLVVSQVASGGILSTTNYDVFPDSIPSFEATAVAVKTDSLGATTLALSSIRNNRNIVLLDFDPATGEMTFQEQILNSGFSDTGSEVIYDLEWSPDGSKLYFSRTGDDTNGGNLYQVNLTDTVATDYPVTPVLTNSVFRSFGLKKGPDNRIYHLYQANGGSDPFTIGRINSPDSVVDTGVLYDSLLFEENFLATQFPEFSPAFYPVNYFDSLTFTYLDSCEQSATKFIAFTNPVADRYFWNFGDGNTGVGPAAVHTYDGPTGAFVSLTAELNGYTQSISLPIEILAIDTAVDLGNDTTICVDEILTLDAGEGVQYIWSTGEVTQTIDIDTAGTYWVEVTGPGGCTSFDDIVVTEYGFQRQLSNQWYFGERAGLDFNFTPPEALVDENLMDSPEGCATMSGSNGELLFYTNGVTVWNRDHEIMVGGTNIGGDSTAAQSAIILPFPDDNTMFYIFTTEEVYGDFTFNLKMSIVDIKKDTARGQVLIKDIPIIECSTERVTASGFTGTPYLLAHEYGNNNFRSYQVNDNGVIGPIHSSAGEEHIFEEEPRATGYMKFIPGGNHVAVSIPGANNYVDILDYDLTNGAVSNSRLIEIDEPGNFVYGMEFSADGQNMFITTSSVLGGASQLLKYRLDSLNSNNPATDIQATKEIVPGTSADLGAMQMGPNGIIYIAVNNSSLIDQIQNPTGLTANDISYAAGQVNLDPLGEGRISRYGLPNFTQQVSDPSLTPSISTTVACAGQETLFSGTGRDNSIEFYTWDFGDGTIIANLSSPDTSHVYTIDSTYIVTLTLSNRCDTDSVLTDTVTVFSIPEAPMVPSDTSLCGGSVTLSAWDVDRDDLNYYWSTGDFTRQVTFDAPTVVDVAIINDFGCSSDTVTVFIGDGETFVDLGPDLTICQFDSILLDANDPGPIFTWTQDGAEIGDQRTQLINSNIAGEFVYAVEVINDFTGCIYSDSVTVSIVGAPTVTQANVVNPECSQANGSFALEIAESGNFTYSLSGAVNAGPFTFDGPGLTPDITGLSSGSYTATITNSITGCTRTQTVQLEDNASYNIEAIAQNECARTGDIQITFSNLIPENVEINVFDQFSNTVFSSTELLTTSTFSINDLDSGTYFVEVRDVAPPNCVQIDTVQLSVSQECYETIFVPNAFSPNGNGQNEEWFAYPNEFVDQFEVYVFNRWGDLVYYSTDKNFRWDGTFNGRYVSQGTYAYRMLFTSTLRTDGQKIEQYGSVTVIK
ncbi:T9SS type B sorting domain-containing protein [Marinoscillum pacificum]|uniref:T9SS type B sorting domain-containing protein n=1 Tax=Marinoscillum pacificum TaxID=392723 RepID=UPI00215804C4|nr:gliding motility-associated C-terminal domain-containing protein [Marinoscillum pacificum]